MSHVKVNNKTSLSFKHTFEIKSFQVINERNTIFFAIFTCRSTTKATFFEQAHIDIIDFRVILGIKLLSSQNIHLKTDRAWPITSYVNVTLWRVPIPHKFYFSCHLYPIFEIIYEQPYIRMFYECVSNRRIFSVAGADIYTETKNVAQSDIYYRS